MECDIGREVLSAWLDGEDTGVDLGEVDRHLATCPACAAWYQRVSELDRALRVSPAQEPGPDLTDRIMAQVVLPRRGRLRVPLAAALVVVAVAQFTIGMASLFMPPWGFPMAMATSQHMDHESAAFNLAFGVVMLLVGFNTRRASTQVPVLASFVLVLGVASVFDLFDGAVDWARLATHLPVVVGLVLTMALARQPHPVPGPARTVAPTSTVDTGGSMRTQPGPAVGPGPSRGREDQPPAARRDVA